MRIWEESKQRFGARMIWAALPCAFSSVSLYRLQKIMRGLGIRSCTPHSSRRTTVQDLRAEEKRDLIGRDFTSPIPTYKPYLKTGQGWLYLACVIDLCTRMVMCWALSLRMTADIVISALECAKAQGYVADNAIFHSDKSSQYTSRALLKWAEENHVRLSCSRSGTCHDNAVAESFFGTLKNEMYYRTSFATKDKAKHAVIEFIEVCYNRKRLPLTIDYKIPAQVMQDFFEKLDRATKEVPLAA